MESCEKCGMFNCHGDCGDYNIFDLKMVDPTLPKALDDLLLVSHPNHYTAGGIEVNKFITSGWDVIMGWNLSNVVKYACRANLKGTKEQDLKKIIQYATFELEGMK